MCISILVVRILLCVFMSESLNRYFNWFVEKCWFIYQKQIKTLCMSHWIIHLICSKTLTWMNYCIKKAVSQNCAAFFYPISSHDKWPKASLVILTRCFQISHLFNYKWQKSTTHKKVFGILLCFSLFIYILEGGCHVRISAVLLLMCYCFNKTYLSRSSFKPINLHCYFTCNKSMRLRSAHFW